MNSFEGYKHIESCNPLECISGKMARCARITSNIFRKHLKPFNITNSQLGMLFIITKAPITTQKNLSDKLFMEKSTVNRNLTRLISGGLIEKKDKHLLKTTTKGLVLLEKVIPHWQNAMAEIRGILGPEGEQAISFVQQRLQHKS